MLRCYRQAAEASLAHVLVEGLVLTAEVIGSPLRGEREALGVVTAGVSMRRLEDLHAYGHRGAVGGSVPEVLGQVGKAEVVSATDDTQAWGLQGPASLPKRRRHPPSPRWAFKARRGRDAAAAATGAGQPWGGLWRAQSMTAAEVTKKFGSSSLPPLPRLTDGTKRWFAR